MLPSDGHPPRCSLTNLTPPQHHKPHGNNVGCFKVIGTIFFTTTPQKKTHWHILALLRILQTRTMVTCNQCPGIRNHISRNMFRNDTNDTFAVACNKPSTNTEPSRTQSPQNALQILRDSENNYTVIFHYAWRSPLLQLLLTNPAFANLG